MTIHVARGVDVGLVPVACFFGFGRKVTRAEKDPERLAELGPWQIQIAGDLGERNASFALL